METEKHIVLILGNKVYGIYSGSYKDISVEYCDVKIIYGFPFGVNSNSRLRDYDLVILDYAAFISRSGIDYEGQDIFYKQMLYALNRGTCFCILHYDEKVPMPLNKNSMGKMFDEADVSLLVSSQIGFRWLNNLGIPAFGGSIPIIAAKIERNEFQIYLERWGASKNYFNPYGREALGDIIYSLGNGQALGFSLNIKRGKIIFMPCQRNFNQRPDLKECLETLIDSILTYLTRTSTEIPDWAKEPIFEKEEEVLSALEALQSQVNEQQGKLQPYSDAKSIFFLREYDFEDAVPKFINTHFGLNTFRLETYKEDFWILNSQGEKIVIAETKSYTSGFKKSGVYSIHNHREANGLDVSFPGLLIVNANLNAKSWKDKSRPIDSQDYTAASSNNILIMRIEDLIFLWNSFETGVQNGEEFISLLLSNNGWMEVKPNGIIKFHK